ncbi:glycoside hydrolase superfamily [Venturia nashicola]|uniref:Beta-xylanase n=1 Tax=Venturia nashicola TaxID=86259 RepID=A0A4Z1PQR2_9PEZI|nr:glycoside hydrolase superfamily [Venturia nashicola]TLD38404.1 glycoside hydrolase superfamily [Venturia nashicola]
MKSTLVLTSLALALSSSAVAFPQPQIQTQPLVTAPESIDKKFKALGKKYFGTCTDKLLLSKAGGLNAPLIKQIFGQVTPENSMKWDSIQPKKETFQWFWPDYVVEYAQNNSLLVRGHTFLWHSQLPQWVQSITDKTELRSVLEKQITTAMTRYKGRIYAWDVANEILDESGNFRQSVWSKVLGGDEMVKIAFEAAKKADPTAKLYINDYNLDSATYPKTLSMIKKVTSWRAAGIPIDGIGSQSHLKSGQAKGVKAALSALCAAASECAITELDVEQAKADEYATAVKACVDVANCVGVTVWGVSDSDSWRKSTSPLLFDANFSAKPAYAAVLALQAGNGTKV